MFQSISQTKKLIIGLFVCFIVLFAVNIGTANASVAYNAGTNTIMLIDGTNTLASMYSELSNPSILAYNSGTNTYTLHADISADFGTNADLVLEDATLIINDTDGIVIVPDPISDSEYSIKAPRDLTISNMTIQSYDSKLWKIWLYGKPGATVCAYSASVTDSDFSGGLILIQCTGYYPPSTPAIIKNNYFHDTTMITTYSESFLALKNDAARNGYIYNNTFENMHLTGAGGTVQGIIATSANRDDLVVDGLYFRDCSVNGAGSATAGCTLFYGPGSSNNPATITNFEITNISGNRGNALAGKEYHNIIFSNGTIRNISGKAFAPYYRYGNGYYYLWNISIDGAAIGIPYHGYNDEDFIDCYNLRMNNVGTAYHAYGDNMIYITNSKVTNYNILYRAQSGGDIREYQLADIYVVDSNNNPIENATVTITDLICDVSDCSINRKLISITQTQTLSNGHTPLPDEDKDNTVVLLGYRKTSTTEKSDYSYNITASKDGYTNSTIVNPDETWYRSDPNTYQKTITIVLDMGGSDTTPPSRSNGSPTGTLSSGTTSTNISLTTNENSTCKYSTTHGVSYSSMPNTFSTTGTTSHSQTITGLTDGNTYTYYVRCIDSSNNPNTDDYPISFSIAEPQANELVAHYNFNETSGTNASDSSGNNNNGTLINNPVWISGQVNNGLQFDGNDNYVEVSDSTSLDSINSEITLMAWINPSISSTHTILEKWLYGTGINERSFALYIDSDRKINFELSSDGTNSSGIWLISENSVSNNIWTHITVTSDGTTVKIYINGQLDPNTVSSPAGIYQSTANLHIGRWWTANQWYHPFNGSLDELKIYNYALTQLEIQSNYQSGLGSDTIPPTGSILINSGDEKTNSTNVNLTISANDSSGLSEMKTSETNDFSSASAEPYSTIKSFVLSIGDGIKTIYIWFKDTIGNWNLQPYSDSIELDSTGPIISNIQSTNITTSSSTITFNTNENSTSQIEYGLTSSYGSQTTKDETLVISHSVNLSNLSSNTTYHYRIISEDGLGNSSNSIDQTFKTNQSSVPDTTPPQAITDLESDDITQTSADLEWTSPGDDGNTGTASSYDIRYSTSNITESNWNSATQITGEPIPEPAGTEQSIYIAVGLSPNTKYYFAIKTSDEVPNTSDISNILSFTTLKEDNGNGGGGGGGGGTVSDTTPPSKPSNFQATGADKQITLKWNNPTDSDFVRILLIKKEDSFPTSKDDGTIVYEGTNQEYTDIELDNSKTYYYAIFAYDKKPNYSNILTLSAKPIEGKTSIPNGNGKQTYSEGTLLKIPESFKIYVIINQKKKWIPTPEVFETLGYQWTSITEINKTELNNIPDYEDNLIRAIQDYKVYLVVSGIKRHIPNPEIFLNYGFEWDDVKDVRQETINKYSQNLLIKESKQQKVYYLCPERKIRRWLRSPEIFNSYNNKWEDIQVISKYEMEFYQESNLIKLIGGNKVYLIENNKKRWIKSAEEFNRLGLDWGVVMEVGEVEINFND